MKSLFLLCLLLLTSCSDGGVKTKPEHVGVDPELKAFEQEFKDLARERGITFTHDVTVGFSDLDTGILTSTIGLCSYDDTWREIDIDKKFFHSHLTMQRRALVFHELTHCYCGRGHTYGSNAQLEFPDPVFGIFKKLLSTKPVTENEEPAYFKDGCSVSIMHPIVVSYTCMYAHYDHYIDEMFNRCKPY